MTSLIAAGGSGRSTSVIPANPAASSVTTIAFILHLAVSRMRLHRTLDSPTPQPSHGTPGEPARTLLLCAVEQAGPRQALPSARLLPSPNGLDRPGAHREAARSDAPEEPDRSGGPENQRDHVRRRVGHRRAAELVSRRHERDERDRRAEPDSQRDDRR